MKVSSRRFCSVVCVAVALLFVVFLPSSVGAITDDPIVSGWSGPSTDQTFDTSSSTIQSFIIRKASFPIFLSVVGVMVLIAGPYICCFRYCCQCCGSANMRPGHLCCGGAELDFVDEQTKMRQYSRVDVLCNHYATYIALLIGVAFLIMGMTGAGRISKIPQDVLDGVKETVDWVLDILQHLIDAAVDSSASGIIIGSASGSNVQYVQGFDFATFKKIRNSLHNAENSATDTADATAVAFRVSAGLGFTLAAPLMVIGLGVIAAACNCRICLPYLTVCSAVIMQFVVFFFATLVLLLLIPINVVCEEVDAQISKSPGLFQWYIVPQCQTSSLIGSASGVMNTAESKLGGLACDSVRSLCNSTTSSGANYLSCDSYNLTICATIADAANILGSSVIVSNSPCGSSTTSCSVHDCAVSCTDPQLKQSSKTTMKTLTIGVRLIAAIETYLIPNLKCNVLIDRLLKMIPVPLCNDLRGGFNLLAAASIMAGISLLAIIVLMFRGQKRFFDINSLPPLDPNAAAMQQKPMLQDGALPEAYTMMPQQPSIYSYPQQQPYAAASVIEMHPMYPQHQQQYQPQYQHQQQYPEMNPAYPMPQQPMPYAEPLGVTHNVPKHELDEL